MDATSVARQVNSHIQRQFGGDQRRAFNHYAAGGAEVSRAGVNRLLSDARVPLAGLVTGHAMDHFDTNRNNAVSWAEFQAGMARAR